MNYRFLVKAFTTIHSYHPMLFGVERVNVGARTMDENKWFLNEVMSTCPVPDVWKAVRLD
jgi:hypothetical protein